MCKQCETNPVYEFTNKRKVCRLCFVKWFEKKFLYTVRKFSMLPRDSVVGYDNKGFRGKVLEHLLKMFTGKGTITIKKLKTGEALIKSQKRVGPLRSKALGRNIRANANTSDTETYKIINEIIMGKEKNLKVFGPKVGNVVKPLYLFLDKEVLIYCKIKKLKCGKEKVNNDEVVKFIDNLEKKHPELKHSVVNSWLGLYG